MKPYDKKIVLEDGREFYGYGFGSDKEAINEIVSTHQWWAIRKLFRTRLIRIKWCA